MTTWLNGELISWDTYPNGETIIPHEAIINAERDRNVVRFRWTSDIDLIRLDFLAAFIHSRYKLIIDYMPYSRMDRGDPADNAHVFSLSVMAAFINGLNFESVVVIEPHSDVTPALLDDLVCYYPSVDLAYRAMRECDFDTEHDILVFPDAGADKRYSSMFPGYRSATGIKHRNFDTGKIERLQVVGLPDDREGRTAIIVDDLCSYGGTFQMASGDLRAAGYAQVILVVAHAEHNILKGGLLSTTYTVYDTTGPEYHGSHQGNLVDRVYCTDSMGLDAAAHERLTVVPLDELYPELFG